MSLFLIPKIFLTGLNLVILKKITKTSRKFHYLHNTKIDSKVIGMTSDLTHQMTTRMYIAITENSNYLYAVVLIMSVCINFSIVALLYALISDGRCLYVSMYTYIFKAICNLLYQNTPPNGRFNEAVCPNYELHWSKNSQTETFFSGHASLMFLTLLFCNKSFYPFVLVSTCIMLFFIIVLRIHYVIDIIGAFLVVYFFNSMVPVHI
jgi:hypothetical protein